MVGESEESVEASVMSGCRAVRSDGLTGLLRRGDAPNFRLSEPGTMCLLRRCEVGGGVFAGDDFCGEIDLARSVSERGERVSVSFARLGLAS